MTALLRHSRDLAGPSEYEIWFAVTGAHANLDPRRKLSGLAARLEKAFNQCREVWWRLGRELGENSSARIAQMPTAAAYGSDFGLMLAWGRLVEKVSDQEKTCLVVCDDPWLFRHLATLSGVTAGPAPPLWPRALRLWLRGVLARAWLAVRMFLAAVRLRHQRTVLRPGEVVLVVYGHPESNAKGYDAYFSNLMAELTGLKRLLHTDCPPGLALKLAADGRTASLHGWGNPLVALTLPFVGWRPERRHLNGPYGWLVRRSAARENGGGGPAMNNWQMRCQETWLKAAKPASIAWPWENHAWERELCRAARRAGVRTIGYQHTAIGPHQFNYSTATNPDGLASIPDLVVSDGPAYREELLRWGVPAERLTIGGAFRFARLQTDIYDPEGPVFVPLSGISQAARQQVMAAEMIAATGRKVLVKEHPMYPLDFEDSPNLSRTDVPLLEQKELSAVLYSTGTSGLEALLAGLPTFRLMLEDRIAIDILPAEIEVSAVTLENVVAALAKAERPPPLEWDRVFAPVDLNIWREILGGPTHCFQVA